MKSLNIRYGDVLPFLDAILQNNGGSYTLATPALATRFLHRVNTARRAFREADPDGVSPYDLFVLRTEGPKVRAERRRPFDPARFERLDGEPPMLDGLGLEAAE